jgi:prophage maintenance system killer protein
MRGFGQLNGYDLRCTVDDGEQVIMAVAAGTREVADIAAWIDAHLVSA